jgi:hypothetical protein
VIDWDKTIAENHLHCWPPEHPAGFCVQNAKPPHETARNIWKEDKDRILAAAAKYGYRQIGTIGKSVSFVRSKPVNELCTADGSSGREDKG